jgi:hypothetical protein
MSARHYDLHGTRIVELAKEGPLLRNERDAVDALGEASQHDPEMIVVPAERLDEDFFRLRTGIAGQVIQKFLTYRLRLVVLGDISRHLRESSALRDFVYECNSGPHVWFVAEVGEIGQRLQPKENAN